MMNETDLIDGTAACPLWNNGYTPAKSDMEGNRLAALDKLFDAGTIQLLTERGVTDGWQCLEVGGGRGSIATWLSERIGPSGHVVVTDINTRFLDGLERPNLEVRRHNIVTDPLPEAAFDLVHIRLVLMHLPERNAVLCRLIKALKPGGWLIDEEFDALSLRADPDVNPREAVLSTSFAMYRVMTGRGVELRFGRLLYERLRSLGLAEVGANARLSMGAGGSVAAHYQRFNYFRFRDAMIEGGHVSAEDFDRDLEHLDDPDRLILTPTLWSAWGRRPQAERFFTASEVFLGAGI
jgi:ubiquinone/menaquinone biosynthesis C-methylase UbiE